MSESPRLLVIEDDREIAQGLCIRLEASGYEVFTACDGQAGLLAARRCRPDLILLDVRLPVMDGLSVLVALGESEHTRRIPVVMLSASLVDKRKAIEKGARHFLQKPFEPRVLTALISSNLQQARMQGVMPT